MDGQHEREVGPVLIQLVEVLPGCRQVRPVFQTTSMPVLGSKQTGAKVIARATERVSTTDKRNTSMRGTESGKIKEVNKGRMA